MLLYVPVLKTFQSSPTNTSVTTLFTCPGAYTGIVRAIVLTCPTGTGDTVKIHLKKAGGTVSQTTEVFMQTVASNSYALIKPDIGVEEGDVIAVQMSAGNLMNVNTVVEMQSIYA